MVDWPKPLFNDTIPPKDLEKQMEYYKALRGLGLYVVPKQKDNKLPLVEYWRKNNRQYLTSTTEAQEKQSLEGVYGWNVITGEQSGRLIVLDFDTSEIEVNGNNPIEVYEEVQKMSPSSFVLQSPANGVHIYYRLPESLEMIGNIKPPIKGLDVRGEGGQVVSLGGYNTYTGQDSVKKGVPDGHTGTYTALDVGDYSHIPFMSGELYNWLLSRSPKTLGENYGKTASGEKRVSKHTNQPIGERETITIECLSFILPNWGTEHYYEEWLQLWMSAHHASGGSPEVRDYIINSEHIYWRDGVEGQRHFRQAWDTFEHNDSGYTVSSLYYLARQAGWLEKTGYEIPDSLFTDIINKKYIDFDEIPERMLLMSQTGSGKTFFLSKMYQRLGQPKTVVFVPSIKLAIELASTLNKRGVPAEVYINPVTGKTRPSDELIAAHVLVTTLQTFSNKIHAKGVSLDSYDLVYVEESDQLLAQFSRGGGGLYGSHVSEREAVYGFSVIREAVEKSKYVWFVDATMSSVTYNAVNTMITGKHSLRVVKNTYVSPKADVHILDRYEQALQIILDSLSKGLRTVVAVDTANRAEEIVTALGVTGALDNKNYLLVIRKTERHREVIEFMKDVNKGANFYDLLVYNSVMASGVSIDEVEADVVVQICTYLPPRVNLQMLNRYRKQGTAYVYYRDSENIFTKNADQVYDEAVHRAWVESQTVGIPLADRTKDAILRTKLASLSMGDTYMQMRSPISIYKHLLREDGRRVFHLEDKEENKAIKYSLNAVKRIKKEQEEYISKSWPTVPPIDKENPASPEDDSMTIALGETHALIVKILNGNIPEDVPPERVFKVVKSLKSKAFILGALMLPEKTLHYSSKNLADKGKALISITSNMALVKLVSYVKYLYDRLEHDLTPDILDSRYEQFLIVIDANRDLYDTVVVRNTQKYEVLRSKYSGKELAVALSKVILSQAGVKQRAYRFDRKDGKARYAYRIENVEDIRDFIHWRYGKEFDILDETELTIIIGNKEEATKAFALLSDPRQRAVLELMSNESVSFEKAVEMEINGIDRL